MRLFHIYHYTIIISAKPARAAYYLSCYSYIMSISKKFFPLQRVLVAFAAELKYINTFSSSPLKDLSMRWLVMKTGRLADLLLTPRASLNRGSRALDASFSTSSENTAVAGRELSRHRMARWWINNRQQDCLN